MTEATQVNAAVRTHLGPLGRFLRFEHAHDNGWPDWYYVLRGTAGWVEAKLIPPSGRPPKHFTKSQLMWGEDEVNAGGRWHLLGLRLDGKLREWVVYDTLAARRWFDTTEPCPSFVARGPFPTRELVELLAPRRRTEGAVAHLTVSR